LPCAQALLNIRSIHNNAFDELTNLTYLHLMLTRVRPRKYEKLDNNYLLHLNVQPEFQPHINDFLLDIKHLINLKELVLEGRQMLHSNYLDLSPPPNLEKLTIVYFAIKLNTLTHLKKLNFLRLDKVQALGLSDSKAFLDFACLKILDFRTADFGSTNLVFDCSTSSALQIGPTSLEVLNMGHIGCINGQQPKIFFDNLPNIKKLQVVVKSLEKIDLVSLKKLSTLEYLRLVVEQCNDERELIRILENFSKLKKLSVHGLSRVDREFIKKFPNLESLSLNLESLNLWGNLRDIQSGSFDSSPNLTVLHLRRNNLEQLDVDLFKSLNKLVSLDLSQNPLKRIPSKLFANLAALNVLNLERCELIDLEPINFHGLDNLTQLYLSYNNLTHLDEASFKGLKNLTQLYLRFNKLTEINEETFRDTCNLIMLELYKNQLIDIRFGLNNQSLQKLKCLNLSGNKLEQFEINLRNLEELYLSFNETLEVRPGAFKNLSNLKRLRLDRCSLRVVDANTFEGLFSLEHLNLAENGLEDIGVGAFDFMKNLKELNISKNHSLLRIIFSKSLVW
jgi:Leucine-rich repeat (LRR) protein